MLNYSCPVVSCRLLLSKMKDLVPKKEKQFMEGMLGVVVVVLVFLIKTRCESKDMLTNS